MRYLLCGINAKYIHSNLAIFSLQAYAKERLVRKEDEIIIKEYTINHYVDNILQDLYEAQADVIIFSCYIWNISYVRELSAELKKICPSCAIWVGGPEVSYDARQFLNENPAVDLVMQGEGEEVFSILTNTFEGNMDQIPKLQGIALRRKEEIEDYGFAPLMDMDALPFVYEDFHLFEHKILYYETSRGCPFCCSYCLSSIDKSVRFRSMEKVKHELDLFLAAKVPQVKFVDRTFNCNRKRSYDLWKYINDHDNGITNFHFEISSDLLDEESLSLFAQMRPGLIQLEIGVQSTNPPTIDAIRRHMDLPLLFQRVDQVHALGNIHQHLDLIAGLPYEDYDQFAKSFDDLYAHVPDQLQLGFLKVLKGTQMMLESQEHIIQYRNQPPYEVLSTKWLPYDKVIALKGVEELVELYYNSGQYINTLRYVIPFFASPFAFYEEFSSFYRGKEYHKVNHNRLGKYEILREFLQECHLELPLLDDLMLYDLYLRENVKGRPKWAPELSDFKKEWKEIYREGREMIFPDIPEEIYDSKKAQNQTHMEYFRFDIHAWIQNGAVNEGDYFCLFDYQMRNPLNQEARTVCFPR
ncbi:MAG: B12-binding domain-containing radical SAM protein [Eubacteriales bacterium]|nr:B12-binding domain-containing radical SAM protein [Eubacteriales bacterium]